MADITAMESRIDTLNLSSLVVELGGFGAAYPAIVSPEMTVQHVINAAVEEWAHQYLALRPLGALYLVDCLGIRQPGEIIIMNESVAGIIADEIGNQVYEHYYKETVEEKNQISEARIDFAYEMRKTRLNVDVLLNAGLIDEAEQYMEKRRIYFEQSGYIIRKLNQAYFAFHGIYGDDPGAISPIHSEILELRKGYTTLAGFVNDVSGMTGHMQLKNALKTNL